MDGARIANAAVALNKDFKEFTVDAGVDILSFGGTKNGMMFGEAIVTLNNDIKKNLSFIRKQGMQLHSKMRFISAQFEALLTNDLWKTNAAHANNMAKLLERQLNNIKIKLTQSTNANGVFALLPKTIIPKLQEKYPFYVWTDDWNETHSEVRFMCSFDILEKDVTNFVKEIKLLIG